MRRSGTVAGSVGAVAITQLRESGDERYARPADIDTRVAEALASARVANPGAARARDGRDYRMRRMLVAADVTALLIATSTWILTGAQHGLGHALWALPTIPVWLGLFLVYGLYSTGLRRVTHETVDDIPSLSHVFLLGGVAMWLYFHITPPGKLDFDSLLVFVVVGFLATLTLRSVARALGRRVLGAERVLLVGSGPLTPMLVRQMSVRPSHGFDPVGVLTRDENERWPLELRSLGRLGDVDPVTLLLDDRIDRVMVSAEGLDDDQLLDLINVCRKLDVKVSVLPSLAAMMGPGATIDQLDGITLIGINTPTLARSSRIFKRAMDLVGASVLMLVTAPFWALIAIAIKLDSRGPVFFRQERVGRLGRRFQLAKFRSMVADAEAQRDELIAESRQEGWLDLEADPRITRVGRFLRHTSLDELPQLWSVLRGDMSLVGPRPLIPQEDENVTGWGRSRLDLTPGITGLWQVLGRTHIPFEQMVMIDYLYVSNWSMWTDITLLLRTLPVVLSRRGAN
jgi:exopolysaccharide biosynthesis polyprenyl glycosylphosphotransferase